MNAFAWTSVIMLAFLFLGTLIVVVRWTIEILFPPRRIRDAVLKYAGEFSFCCAIGLLTALFYFLGALAEINSADVRPITTISTR